MNTSTDELINERFRGGLRDRLTSPNWQWTLTDWEYYGATNYVSLLKDPSRYEGYKLVIETESGYALDPFVAGVYNEQEVLRLIEGFQPTNPNFKTDRK